MISCRFLFGIFAFCLLWIWLFSGNSKSKRAINVKTNTYEEVNSFTKYFVSNLSDNVIEWSLSAKPALNFAGASFEVIPVAKSDQIILGLYSDQNDVVRGLILKLTWENSVVNISVTEELGDNFVTYSLFSILYNNKFTVYLKSVSYFLRTRICSNYQCEWKYITYPQRLSLLGLKFNTFFISLKKPNSALIRGFKLQKFLLSPKALKYLPLLSSSSIISDLPTINSAEITYNLKNFKTNESAEILCSFLFRDNITRELKLNWNQWPTLINMTFDSAKNGSKTLSIPYSDLSMDWLTVYLYFEYSNNQIIMKVNNQNTKIIESFEPFYQIIKGPDTVISVDSDEGNYLDEKTDSLHPANVFEYFVIRFKRAVCLIEFHNIYRSVRASIGSSIGYSISLKQSDGKTTLTFNQRIITINHEPSNPKPDIELFLEKDVFTIFTSDGKNGFIESGISPGWFTNITISERDSLWVKVKTMTFVKPMVFNATF